MWVRAWVLAAVAAALFAAGGSSAWLVQGWRCGARLAALEKEHAQQRVVQAEAALKQLADASEKISVQASTAKVDITALNATLAGIRKDMKNAKVLSIDCRPDDIRLQRLQSAVDAVNAATAGRESRR